MKNQKILYILISIFCVFAVIAGIYAQFIDKNQGAINIAEEEENDTQEKTQEEIREVFNNLFTNNLNLNGFDTTGIQKIDTTKDIVYSAYDIEEKTDKYEINM